MLGAAEVVGAIVTSRLSLCGRESFRLATCPKSRLSFCFFWGSFVSSFMLNNTPRKEGRMYGKDSGLEFQDSEEKPSMNTTTYEYDTCRPTFVFGKKI